MGALDFSKNAIPSESGALADFSGQSEEASTSLLRRAVGDPLISLAKGVVGVPEAVVGLADLVTGGRVGNKLATPEGGGFRPADAKAFLDEFLSPAQKEANRTVSETKGFLPTVGAAVTNPSTILHSAVESLPSMAAGGVAARGAIAAAPKLAPWAAGALGEGAISAGATAEQVRQQTADGLLTPEQAMLAGGSGALTAGFGAAGGKLAQKLGITDIDTLLAGEVQRATGRGMPARVLGGAAAEGVFEEWPQSMQEQAMQNLALDKPVGEGVAEAGAMGMLAGGLMGGGTGVVTRREPPATVDPIQEAKAKAKAGDATKAAMDLLKTAVGDVLTGKDTLGAKNDRTKPDTAPGQTTPATQEKVSPTQFGLPNVGERITLDMEGDKVSGELIDVYRAGDGWGVRVRDDNGQVLEATERDATIVPDQPKRITPDNISDFAMDLMHKQAARDLERDFTVKPTSGTGTRADPVKVESSADLEAAAQVASTEYTPPQGEANNIQRGHVDWQGLQGTIEVPAGGVRKGTNPENGEAWETTHSVPYGYFRGIPMAADGQHPDVYWGKEPSSSRVFVIDEVDDKTGTYRQSKSFVGFTTPEDARAAYLGTSSKSEASIGGMTELSSDAFVKLAKSGGLSNPLATGENNGKEQGSSRHEQTAGVSGVEGDENALHKSERDQLQGLRGARGDDITSMDGQLPGISHGGRDEAVREAQAGKTGQQPRVRARQRNLGDSGSAELQQTPPSVGETGQDGFTTRPGGESGGADKRGAETAAQAGHERGRGAKPAELAPSSGDAERTADAGRGSGAATGTETRGSEKQAPERDERSGGTDTTSDKANATPRRGRAVPGKKNATVLDQIRAAAAATGKKPAAVKAQFLKDKEAHGEEEALKRLPKAKPEPKLLGKNTKGEDVYEDENGVRSYVKSGVQVTESVEIIPGRGIAINKSKRTEQYKTAEEIAAEKPAELSPEEQAKADLKAALGDLGDLLLTKTGGKLNITPEQEQKLLPIMTRLFDAAFRLGHVKFKAAARFVRDQITGALGNDAADLLTIDQYQGGYIAMSGRYRDKGSETAKEVAQVETLDEPAEEPKQQPTTDEMDAADDKIDAILMKDSFLKTVGADTKLERGHLGKLGGYVTEVAVKYVDAAAMLLNKREIPTHVYEPILKQAKSARLMEGLADRIIANARAESYQPPSMTEEKAASPAKADDDIEFTVQPLTPGAKAETMTVPANPAPKRERWEGFEVRPSLSGGNRYDVGEPRGDGTMQYLAAFDFKDGRVSKIKHNFESPQTRDPAEKAINRWVSEQSADPVKPQKEQVDVPKVAGPSMTLVPGTHTKTGAAIWTVKLGEKVERDEYTALASKAKRHGGTWSRFTKGFLFKDEAKAKAFMGQQPAEAKPDAMENGHYAAGVADAKAGETRELPSYFTDRTGKNAKAWLAGWDSVNSSGSVVSTQVHEAPGRPRIIVNTIGDKKPATPQVAAMSGTSAIGAKPSKASPPYEPPASVRGHYTPGNIVFSGYWRSFDRVLEFKVEDRSWRVKVQQVRKVGGEWVPVPGEDPRWHSTDPGRDDRVEERAAAQQPEPNSAPIIEPEENPNGTLLQQGSPDRPGAQALEGTPSGEVSRPEGSGDAGEGTGIRGGSDASGNAGVQGVRAERPRSMAGEPGTTPSAEGREPGRPNAGQSSVRRDGRSEQDDAGRLTQGLPFPAGNFVITDDLGLGQGGTVQKYNDNIAAIRLLKEIEADSRQATEAEQRVLARYVGWGGIKQAFPNPNNPPAKGWEKRVAEIRELLTPEEHETAARSIQDAHYTSKSVVDGMWKIAKRLGFDGGKVLESSMGVGNFFGLMPEDLRAGASLTGIELDSITARIAKQLYPKANVMGPVGFHEVNLADNTFNLSIGNPPFGEQALYDSNAKHLKGFSIHNFFFAKAIDKLAPGGLHIAVVSRYFMDAQTSPARDYIAHRAEFVGAIRLPWTAFSENANTEVVTDIVILKKLPESQWGTANTQWTETKEVPDPLGGDPMRVNWYFSAFPPMVLGQMDRSGEMRFENDITVQPREGQSIEEGLEDAMTSLPENIYERGKPAEQVNAEQVAAVVPEDVIENYSIGQYFEEDGKLLQRVMTDDGSMKAVAITAETQWSEKTTWGDGRMERLRGMIGIRTVTRELLKAEATDEPDAKIKKLRSILNKRYDAFTAKHGYLNETANERVFAADPDAPLLLALEDQFDGGISPSRAKTLGIKPRKAAAKKMPIFTQRVVRPHLLVTSADSPEDGLALSISEKGMVSIPYIAGLTRQSEQDVIEALTKGAKPQIYFDPAKKGYELAADYMAGNVKRKYREALDAGLHDQAEALKKVFPEDVKAGDLRARLGSPWIDRDAYEGFVAHLLGEDAKATIRYVQATGGFAVHIEGGDPVMVRTRWGTEYRHADDLINRILNSRDLTVYGTDSEGNRFVRVEETQAARDKADEISQEFEDWIFKDPDQRERLVQFYNDNYNTNINSAIDGSYLKLPGKVPDAVIKLRRHQLNAVARLIRRGKALLDHVVGAGKTFTIIAGVMEKRRLGLAKKPMIVVPNHLVEQWATDFYRLYPGAKVLAMRKKDFEKTNRQRMLARVATGDWDAVIFSHSSFGFIENDREVLLTAIRKQVSEIQRAIDVARETEGKKSRTASQYQKTKEKLEQRIKALIDKPRDKLLNFQEIGVDDITVDESQEFKNLFFTTQKQNVGGFGNPTGSKKAFDMFIKTQWLQKTNGGRGVTFATGTPVSNSLTELFTLQRYLGMDELEARGITSLDAWLGAFGVVQSEYESNVTGTKYKRKERLRRLTNVPEVMQLYKGFADSITNDQIKQNYREDNNGEEFPIPSVKSAPKSRENIVVPRTALQQEFSAGLQLRMEQLKRGGTDNALAILGDGRKAALDMRLVDPSAPDHKGSKTHEAADQIHRIYKEWEKKSGTQLIFLDISTPLKHGLSQAKKYLKEARDLLGDSAAANYGSYGEQWNRLRGMLQERMESMEDHDEAKGVDKIEKFLEQSEDIDAAVNTVDRRFSVYDDMRAKLIERGIPNNEIAFIHDFNGDAKKQELFDMVNAGRVRVLLGSTAKMGAGTNVQRKLVAIHHMDAPWRPSDIEQREGRGIRQGNEFRLADKDFAIEILAYATEGTSDVFFWQTQEQKLNGINSLRNFKGEREIEEVSMDAMSAAEMKALSSGNPLILEDVQLTESIRKLEGQRRRHISGQQDMESEVRKYDKAINGLPPVIERQEGEVAKILAYQEDPFEGSRPTADMDGKPMNAQEADRYVNEVIAKAKDDHQKANAAVFEQIAALDRQASGEKGNARKNTLDKIEALETKLPPVEWAVTFAGKEYHNKDTVHRAIVKALGDVDAIRMVIGGESLIRRSEIEAKIEPVVQGFAEDNKGEHDLGTIAGLPVKLSWLQSRGSRIPAAVKIELGGEIEYVHGPNDEQIGAGQSAEIPARSVRNKIESLLSGAAYSLTQNKRYLDQAKKGVEPLRASLGKEWGKDDELNEKRARLTFVRNELSGKNAEDKAKAEAEASKNDAPEAKFSRRRITAEDTKLTAAVTLIAEMDDAFQRPTPKGKSVDGIAKDIDPGFTVRKMTNATAGLKGAKQGWEITAPTGRGGEIYDNGRSVWINVSRLLQGRDIGNRIYGIAAAYAHNTGKVLIGDPDGLSKAAYYRRTENMLSSALKFGTTDHLAPHEAQSHPDTYYHESPEFADKARPMAWKDGDTAHNLRELLITSYTNTTRSIPDLENVTYNFTQQRFERDGAEFTDADFGRLVDGARGLAAPNSIGSATAKRAALINTFRRGTSKAVWTDILAEIGAQLSGRGLDPSLREILYSRGKYKRDRAGGSVHVDDLRALKRAIKLAYNIQTAASIDEWPADLRKLVKDAPHNEGIDAAFFGGEIWLAADRIPDIDTAQNRIIHEATHGGLKGLFGDDLDAQLIRVHQANQNVRDRVAEMRAEMPKISIVEATEEVLVDMAANGEAKALKGWNRFVAWIRNWLRSHGFKGAFVDSVTDDDVLLMLQQAGEVAEGKRRGQQRYDGYSAFSTKYSRAGGEQWPDLAEAFDRYDDTGEDTAEDLLDQVEFLLEDDRAPESLQEAADNFREAIREDFEEFAGRGDTYAQEDAFVEAVRRALAGGSAAPVAEASGETLGENKEGSDDPDVRFSRGATMHRVSEKAREQVGDILTSHRTFNRWWHTTIGTQFHKAEQDRDFKKVFDLGQEYLTDATRYAMIPEQDAPDLLLRLEKIGDVFKRQVSAKDMKAITAPIFNGTLTDETVYSDEELRDQFDLTDKQIDYYRQFRAAVDRSLDEMTKSVLAKMARTVGVEESLIRKLRTADISLEQFHKPLLKEMRAQVKDLEERAEQTTGPDKALRTAEAATKRKQIRAAVTAYNRVGRLKKNGYAPLMRFGEHTVHVRGEDGESVYFGLYESQREANAAARALAEEYPDDTVIQDVLSKESYKLYNGLSPETVELFADIAGMDKEPAFQEYLRQAVNNRSALKRLMKRKGTPGFSEDVTRVLAQFIVSNARTTAGNYHIGDLQKAAESVKSSGDAKDEAVKLWKYLTDPEEEAGWLRGYLFFNFLGGSVASALVNATQPVTMTAPYLTQFVSSAKVGKIMAQASMEAAKDAPGEDVKQAYDRAMKEGVVAPHEIYQLMAAAQGQAGSGHLARLMKGWGSFFSLAEAFNRRISFIAAYRVALEAGMPNPYKFAKNAVAETQGLYNKGNRPNWARGAMGATIFTFKQFSISYMEWLKRLPPKQRVLALSLLFLAAGAEGEPFAEDIMDLVDTIGQWMGHATNSKRWLRRTAAEALGERAGQFVLHGVSAFIPIDISARMGLGNLIPGTDVLQLSKSGISSRQPEALGPVGGLIDQGIKVVDKLGKGEFLGYHGAARTAMPVALQNAIQGMEMWQKGEYVDAKGNKVIDVTGGEAIYKAAGFQPASVAKAQAKVFDNVKDVNLVKATESAIADKWAHGLADQDSDKIAAARRELIRWNANNPDMRIVITGAQLKTRVKAINSTRSDRALKTTPKEMRGRVAEDLR